MPSHSTEPYLLDIPQSMQELQDPPARLFALGDSALLDSRVKIAIIGTRKPNTYTQTYTTLLAKSLANIGAIIVSGGALGTDIIAHSAALPKTICVLPTSLDRFYPASNAKIIQAIADQGLLLSEYECNPNPQRHDFLHRNRLIVALSDIVIIPQADRFSGSLASANLCTKLGKPIFVLSHRIGESLGTQDLLAQERASAITDIEAFTQALALRFDLKAQEVLEDDELLDFARSNPTFEEAFARFGEKVLEYELMGKITRENGRIIISSV